MKKKIVIGLGVAGIFLFVSLGVVTYFGIKAAGYLISKAPTQEQVSTFAENVVKHDQPLITTVVPVNCWTVIQSSLNVNVWLVKPISENTDKLMKACFHTPEAEAQGEHI